MEFGTYDSEIESIPSNDLIIIPKVALRDWTKFLCRSLYGSIFSFSQPIRELNAFTAKISVASAL